MIGYFVIGGKCFCLFLTRSFKYYEYLLSVINSHLAFVYHTAVHRLLFTLKHIGCSFHTGLELIGNFRHISLEMYAGVSHHQTSWSISYYISRIDSELLKEPGFVPTRPYAWVAIIP